MTMRITTLVGMLAFAVGAGWTGVANAQLFSSTGPVIAILDGHLLVGEAIGHLGGWGTIALRSQSEVGLTCVGEFSATDPPGDSGTLRCSNGVSAAFRFKRLTLVRGYGAGTSSDGVLSFTYGLNAEDSEPYLKLPPGKVLRSDGKHLELVAAVPLPPR